MRYILFILIIALGFQCTGIMEAEEYADNPLLNINVKETIDFELGANLTYKLGFFRAINDTLIAYDQDKNKLDLYNISKGEHIRSVPFHTDGPNSIPTPDGVYVHTIDSVFCYTLESQYIYLVNGAGELTDRIRFPEYKFPADLIGTGGSGGFMPLTYYQPELFEVPFYYTKNGFYFSNFLSSNFSGTKSLQTTYTSPIVVNLPTTENESLQYFGKWPEAYKAAEYPNNPMNIFIVTEGNVVVSYYNNEHLYASNEDKFFLAKSNFSRKDGITTFKASGEDSDPETELRVFNIDEGYVNFIYDPFRKLYYRAFKKEQHTVYNTSGLLPHKLEAEWSIVVLDANFKVKGEASFPASVYNYMNIIPTQKGVMISKGNIYAEEFNEQILSFDVIEFTKPAIQ